MPLLIGGGSGASGAPSPALPVVRQTLAMAPLPSPTPTGPALMVVLEDDPVGTAGLYVAQDDGGGAYWQRSEATSPRRVDVVTNVASMPATVPGPGGLAMVLVLEDMVAGDGSRGLYIPESNGAGGHIWVRSSASDPRRVEVVQSISSAPIPPASLIGSALLVALADSVPGDGTAGVYRAVDDGVGGVVWQRISGN